MKNRTYALGLGVLVLGVLLALGSFGYAMLTNTQFALPLIGGASDEAAEAPQGTQGTTPTRDGAGGPSATEGSRSQGQPRPERRGRPAGLEAGESSGRNRGAPPAAITPP